MLLKVEDIDPLLCTHLVYSFAGLDERTNKMVPLDPSRDLPDGGGLGKFYIKYFDPFTQVTNCPFLPTY